MTAITSPILIEQGEIATNQIKESTPMTAAIGPGIPSRVLRSVPNAIAAEIKKTIRGSREAKIIVFTHRVNR